MISLSRINAVALRHLIPLKRALWLIEISYWTLLDIIVFGLMGKAASLMSVNSTNPVAMHVLIINAILWFAVLRRGALATGFTLLNELFDVNLTSLFATPLRCIEWLIAAVIVGSVSALINLTVGWILALVVFGYNILALGMPTVALIAALIVASWAIGLVEMVILLMVGKTGIESTFIICWTLAPLSCVYYSIDVLPVFVQKIALCIPMTHIFIAIRTIVATGSYSWSPIIVSFMLAIMYFCLAIVAFILMFKRSKKRGLARLELEW
jgi:ABC-2 type transport system permease protein